MGKDFLKKEPTKTEKMMYDIMMNQQLLERRLYSLAGQFLALGRLMNLKAEDLAKALVDEDASKEFGEKINEEIKKLEAAKKPEETEKAETIQENAN